MAACFFEDSADLPDGIRALFERSEVSLSIADYTAPDCPLVGVNQKFLEICGYEADEVLGRNCRFLQPPGGAGPVRDRMRRYLHSDDVGDAKFVVPNQTRDGETFLNLVYMSKLTRSGKVALVLGSQFRFASESREIAELYDQALKVDLRQLNLLTNESNWVVLGSFEALASSHSIIAQSRIE